MKMTLTVSVKPLFIHIITNFGENVEISYIFKLIKHTNIGFKTN